MRHYCDLWEQQKLHYNGLIKYAEERTKKQVVENITILGLDHNGQKVKNVTEACDLFASETGLQNHERLWQVIIGKLSFLVITISNNVYIYMNCFVLYFYSGYVWNL